jgi:hypothetical protein
MPKATLRIICLALLTTSAVAQTPGYHIELIDDTAPHHSPLNKRIVLFNDSDRTIEAAHISEVCEGDNRRGGPLTHETTEDTLTYSSDKVGNPGPDGTLVFESTTIPPGGKMVLLEPLAQQPSGCTWNAKVDAVIYSNGTYEGDEIAVRGLQARRAGLAAGLNFWSGRLPPRPSDTHLLVLAPAAEAEAAFAKDINNSKPPVCQRDTIACQYWLGRGHVDLNISSMLKRPTEDSDTRYDHAVQEIERWQRKLNSDVALKKLESTFPLPQDIPDGYKPSQPKPPSACESN